MTKNVTILTDENGVQREYTEVRRKANVGERVKVVLSDRGMRPRVGDVVGVVRPVDDDLVEGNVTSSYMCSDNYVVLEPTSTVIIGGVRYREEKRKAAVGDRILITGLSVDDDMYRNGDMFTVARLDSDGDARVNIDEYEDVCVADDEYVVLTPISEPTPTPTVINLAITVNVQPGADVAQAVADAVKAELHKMTASNTPALRKSTEKTPQQLRDEIVERAKADVAELECGVIARFHGFLKEDYVINREKRTVVALLRDISDGKVRLRGIAKCAPGDVFNSHIGRAISLRRALGLEVPAEYLNAPAPTEVRVGDVVEIIGNQRGGQLRHYYLTGDVGKVSRESVHEGGVVITPIKTRERKKPGYYQNVSPSDVTVVDDSREETEVTAVA